MKRIILISIIALLPLTSFCQKLSNYYVCKPQEGGNLYFIFSNDEFSGEKTDCVFKYDMTYSTAKDSVIVNFSYIGEKTIKIKKIAINSGKKQIESSTSKIFIEKEKNKFHYRYSAKFLFSDLNKVFLQETPPYILLANGNIKISMNKGKWKKHSRINKDIFELISLNK